jgi:heat shock protein HslJ
MMRKRTVLALAIFVMVVVTACSSSSSGLTGKVWQLTAITEKTPAFQGVVPAADQANYTIEFKNGGTFDAKADCNMVSGTYTTTSSGGLTIVPGPSTLVACPEGSLGPQYVAGLAAAASYAIANNQLTITLTDGGTLVFK